MELWSSILVALTVLLAAGWLMRWHLRTWQDLEGRKAQLEPYEYDFRRRQVRRRAQTSALLGVVGLGILAGRLMIVWPAPPWITVAFWCLLMLLLVWLGLLAVADIVSTRYYFSRVRQLYMIEQARLQARLRESQQARSDDQPAHGDEDATEGDERPEA